jgi:hypothetical protein
MQKKKHAEQLEDAHACDAARAVLRRNLVGLQRVVDSGM